MDFVTVSISGSIMSSSLWAKVWDHIQKFSSVITSNYPIVGISAVLNSEHIIVASCPMLLLESLTVINIKHKDYKKKKKKIDRTFSKCNYCTYYYTVKDCNNSHKTRRTDNT